MQTLSAFKRSLEASVDTTGGRIVATALKTAPGQFTTLPVVAVDPARGSTSLFFAHVANGSGLTSALALINIPDLTSFLPRRSASPTSGTIDFFDDDGNPLRIPVVSSPSASSVPFSLPARGSSMLTSSGEGQLVSGSVKVTAQSEVGGVLTFSVPELGAAAVGVGDPTSAFIIPVRRNESGFSTGVALASTGTPVTVNLLLRNQRGEPVSGGQALVQLAANGHLARFIEELFPQAATRDFTGTLTATATGGNIVATALQFGSVKGELTTLPVKALR